MTTDAPYGRLLRVLGVAFGVSVAVGEMIGSGILRTPSLVAGSVPVAGAILALWAFGAIHALLQANVLAELATMLPRAGGQYVFVQRAYGAIGGVVIGWTMLCAHLVGLAASALAFADFVPLLWPEAAGHRTALAIAMQVALYAANMIGLREGRALQVSTSVLKVALLLLFVGAAAAFVPAHVSAPESAPAPIGFLALAGAYLLIRGAYNGWHAPAYFAEENVSPGSSIPRSLFIGILLAGTLYLAVNAALLRALGTAVTAGSALPYQTILAHIGGSGIAAVFVVGALITAASCANANVMIAPRVIYALARDRLLPEGLQRVNRGGSPVFAFLLAAAISIPLVLAGGYRLVFGMIGILVTLASLVTEIAYFTLRAREPVLARPWRAILHPWLPGLVVVIDAALLVLFVMSNPQGALIALALCALSVPFAMLVERRRRSP